MSRIRLYLDEDAMDTDLTGALRSRNADVETVSEAGMLNRDDEDQLALSTSRARVLYTCNIRDYQQLHNQWLALGRTHAGLILCQQQRYSVGEQLRRLLRFLAERSAEEMRNPVEYLSNGG